MEPCCALTLTRARHWLAHLSCPLARFSLSALTRSTDPPRPLAPMVSLPCSAAEFQAWRWCGVIVGGALGAMGRFAVGNGILAWRKRRAGAREAARAAQARGEATQADLAVRNVDIAPPPAPRPTSWFSPIPFPLATFVCNVLGCLLVGCLFGLFLLGEDAAQRRVHTRDPGSFTLLEVSFGLCGPWKTFLVTGVIGAFTTMSSLALEFVTFHRAKRTLQGVTYLMLSTTVGMAAVVFGFACTRRFQDFTMHTNR